MKNKKLCILGIVAAFQCFSVIVFQCSSVSVAAEPVDRIVAIVGSDIITLFDLDRAMAPYVNEIKKSPDRDARYKSVKANTLDRLINDILLKQAIENSKITVTNDDVARAIKNVLVQNRITIDMLKNELAGKGISFESYKEDIKKNIMQIKFINQEIGSRVKITDHELMDYYKKHMHEFGIHQSVHIAQIVLPFDETTDREKAMEAKSKAEEIVKSARSGTPFSSLAKEHSKGPNAASGGDLGIVDPSNFLPDVTVALEKMRPGQISDPIVTPGGILIIHLIDRALATEADFEKLRDKIYNTLYEQMVMDELNQYLADARRKTYVEIK